MSSVITNTEAKRNISTNVRRALADHLPPWKQSDLARATDDTEMTISRVIRGSCVPSAALLARIAEALGTTSERLLSIPEEEISQKTVGGY